VNVAKAKKQNSQSSNAPAKSPKNKTATKGKTSSPKSAKTIPAKAKMKSAAKSVASKGAKAVAKPVAIQGAKKSAQPIAKSPVKTNVKITAKKTADSVAKQSSVDVSKAFIPLDDRVLVRRMAVELRTPGGLYIPDTVSSAERPTQGQVVAVGRGHQDKKGRIRPLDVQNGDTVMFAPFSAAEITINNQELLVLREQDILAVVKP
jgi:chaperonin GroES